MTEFHFDFGAGAGKIRAMHAVGQPPKLGAHLEYFHFLTEANIPYSRLHDMGGAYGGCVYVDIPNVFRSFDADENDPENYDFAFTDHLLAGLAKANVKPIYRLGVTIENYHRIKMYRLAPPADFGKWARICEHVIRHYNEGWANGRHDGITYWEIWNEPDNGPDQMTNQMWYGTKEQYYELYAVTAKHLKACFGDTIKVGGFASCGFYGIFSDPAKYGFDAPARPFDARYQYFLDFAEGFLAYVKESGAPMDFFSWHSYGSVSDTEIYADYCDRLLNKYGFGGVETQLNEWNNCPKTNLRGSSFAAAQSAAMMIAMQYKKTDILCFYDARIGQSVYGGLFNPITYQPFCAYYGFKAFGELYRMGTQAVCEKPKQDGVYAVAAFDGNGKRGALFANTGADAEITANLDGMKLCRIDSEHMMTEWDADPLHFVLPANTVAFAVSD